MRRLALLVLLVPACAARYRTETLGTGTAGGAGVAITAAGNHTVAWTVTTPRALRLKWALACGASTAEGEAGETFEAYRERRLGELRAEKQREKDAVASLAGMVGASADVETPNGDAHADVHADGQVVADAVVDDDVALPAGDLGAATYHGNATFSVTEPGNCTMTVVPEDPAEDPAGVMAQFEVTRTIDVSMERAVERTKRRDVAFEVRADLSAQLLALGADPEHQRKLLAEREAELRVRIELDAQAQAELDAQLAADAAVKQQTHDTRLDVAFGVRDELRTNLIAQGADPEHQAKVAAQIEADLRIQADLDLRAQAELDARLAAERAARDEAQWQHQQDLEVRVDIAYEIRERLAADLVAAGADPNYKAKLYEQHQADLRVQMDLDAQAQAAADAKLWADAAARDAAHAERQRKRDAALAVRVELLAYLEGLGAFAKPPMPELPYEDRGEAPADGAVWIAGEWVWRGREWVWIGGGWSVAGAASTGIHVDLPIKVDIGVKVEHRDDPPPPSDADRPKERDHRD